MIRPVIHTAATLGVPVGLMFPIGIPELILLALYPIPSISVLGVVLRTGFLNLREGRLAPLRGNARFERLVAGG